MLCSRPDKQILAYGFGRFTTDAAAAGVDALIVPDVPPEEAAPYQQACQARVIDYIFMLAPTSTDQRIRAVAERASGFIYCVSLIGVTGARAEVSSTLGDFLGRIKACTDLPLLVGFGVSRPEHVRAVREAGADAVVVASALVDLVDAAAPDARAFAVRRFVSEVKQAAAPMAV